MTLNESGGSEKKEEKREKRGERKEKERERELENIGREKKSAQSSVKK